MSSNSIATSTEKNWAMVSHLSSFLGYLLFVGHFAGPLAVLLIKKDESSFIAHHAKESLNFSLSWLIYMGITGAVCFILSFVLIGILMAWILFPLLAVWHLVAIILGAVKASQGKYYYYPMTIRFFK